MRGRLGGGALERTLAGSHRGKVVIQLSGKEPTIRAPESVGRYLRWAIRGPSDV